MGRPANKKRKSLQRKYKRYKKDRDDLQNADVIPMTPEGAKRSEAVDPRTQDEQQFPALVASAVRNGWATPEHVKPLIVDKLIEPFVREEIRLDKDGNQIVVPPDRWLLKENAKVLAQLDNAQHERDHPEEKGKGNQVNVQVNNQVNTGLEIAELMRAVEAQKQVGKEQRDEKQVEEIQADEGAADGSEDGASGEGAGGVPQG